MTRRTKILVLFPLANDAVSQADQWIDIGKNSKCRIDDMVDATNDCRTNEQLVVVFAAGTDTSHSDGPTLATLALRHFHSAHSHRSDVCIVNRDDKGVYGTDPEIVWGVTQVLNQFPADSHNLMFSFGTQKRHMPRVEWIVRRRFPDLNAMFFVTEQTKEIPLWREVISWGKLMLGDGWLAQRVHQLRRAFPNRFDQA